MKKYKITVKKAIEISQGVLMAGDCEFLDATTIYRLNRIKNKCDSINKAYEKVKSKIISSYQKELNSKTTTIERLREIEKIISDKLRVILEHEEEVSFPEIKLSDFINTQNDRVVTIKTKNQSGEEETVTKVIKKNEPYLPLRFFTLLWGIITNDVSPDDNQLDDPSESFDDRLEELINQDKPEVESEVESYEQNS